MAIPSSVRQCREDFGLIFDALFSDANLGSINYAANVHIRLQDEFGRFLVWIGNVSAHRAGRRSLEYRLRDSSNLKTVVIAFITDLHRSLEGLQDIYTEQNEVANDEDVSDSDEGGGPTRDDLINMSLDDIHELISCLLRFSMTLRSPARYDQLRMGTTSTAKYYENTDIEHVRATYAQAPQYLAQRLGRTISKHREYMRYRDQHHQLLIEGLDVQDEAADDDSSSVATSLPQADMDRSSLPAADIVADHESINTYNAFAPSASGRDHLHAPPLPEAGLDGEPFECPICFGIVEAPDEQSWRRHIREDLPPYVCTYEECSLADQTYSRRRDWRHHMSTHYRSWSCPFGCVELLSTATLFKEHLASKHDPTLNASALQRLTEAFARPINDAQKSCELCGKVYQSTKLLLKHVGHHLEQLVLLALPRHLFSEGSHVQATGTDQSQIGHATEVHMVNDEDGLKVGDSSDETSSNLDSEAQDDNFKAHMRRRTRPDLLSGVSRPSADHVLAQALRGESDSVVSVHHLSGHDDQGSSSGQGKRRDERHPRTPDATSAAEFSANVNRSTRQTRNPESTSLAGGVPNWTRDSSPGSPFIQQAVSNPSPQPRETAPQWFIPGDGINRHVISADIQRYLGNDAAVRPGRGTGDEEGVSGYWISAYRKLTDDMLESLRADGVQWRQERRSSGTKQPYLSSWTYRSSRASEYAEYRDDAPSDLPGSDHMDSEAGLDHPGTPRSGYQGKGKVRAPGSRPSTAENKALYQPESQISSAQYGRTPVSTAYGQDPRYAPSFPTQPNDGAPAGYVRQGNYYVPVSTYEQAPSRSEPPQHPVERLYGHPQPRSTSENSRDSSHQSTHATRVVQDTEANQDTETQGRRVRRNRAPKSAAPRKKQPTKGGDDDFQAASSETHLSVADRQMVQNVLDQTQQEEERSMRE